MVHHLSPLMTLRHLCIIFTQRSHIVTACLCPRLHIYSLVGPVTQTFPLCPWITLFVWPKDTCTFTETWFWLDVDWHRDLVLTGCGLTQLFSEVLFSLGSYLHSPLSWQKKSPLEVPWGTGIDITRETQICFLRYIVGPWTNNCNLIPLSVVPSEKWRWVGCYQKPFT